jgi:3-hydroxymyristoyl/3-hydroxydecanoyl-(acyl carrier protein) dehydratase
LPLLVEAVAQAAALLLADTAPGGAQQLFLAGIEDAIRDGTAGAGDTLSIEVRVLARLGSVVRVRGDLLRGETPCGGVTLILSSGGST